MWSVCDGENFGRDEHGWLGLTAFPVMTVKIKMPQVPSQLSLTLMQLMTL